MHLGRWSKDDSGFSLIEVILAMAILALVTLPILNYFTYSAIRTVDGRDTQTATMAAENVMEELSSFSNYKQIKELTATPDPAGPPPSSSPVWKASSPEAGQTPDPQSDYLERKLELNGMNFLAKVRVNYGVYNSSTKVIDESAGERIGTGTGAEIKQEFNDYKVPKPSEVYSPSNVVAVEDDEIDVALSEIYTTVNAAAASGSSGTAVTLDQIRSGVNRTMCVDICYKNAEKKEYSVRVYYRYEYSYGGKNFLAEVTLEQSDVEKAAFKRVFLFYSPLRDGVMQDRVMVRTGSEISGTEQIPVSVSDRNPGDKGTVVGDMEFYFAVQTADSSRKPENYKLDVAAGNALNAKYFANTGAIEGVTGSSSGEGGSGVNAFVDRKTTERIGRVFVDIYELAADGKKSEKPLASMETTKSE